MGTASAACPSPAGPGPIGGAVPSSSGGIQFPFAASAPPGREPEAVGRAAHEPWRRGHVDGGAGQGAAQAALVCAPSAEPRHWCDGGAAGIAACQRQHERGSVHSVWTGSDRNWRPTHFPGHVGAPSGFAAGPAHHLYQSAQQQPSPHDAQAGFGLNNHAAQPHHLHAASASISRLPPGRNAPNPDASTMDEVSRVLAQLAFDRA
ncbi:hypothetical protein L1887_57924 [Cichorium endivia]|nr:hypothetical protein L1887_57924 [Cichorium endivia]